MVLTSTIVKRKKETTMKPLVDDEMVDAAIQYVLDSDGGSDWERRGDELFIADANRFINVREMLEAALNA
jgi:hypothetical protein